jgi:hypothetical protein
MGEVYLMHETQSQCSSVRLVACVPMLIVKIVGVVAMGSRFVAASILVSVVMAFVRCVRRSTVLVPVLGMISS